MTARDLPEALASAVRRLWSVARSVVPQPRAVTGLTALPVSASGGESLVRRCRDFCRGRQRLVAQQSATTCGPNTLAMFRVLVDADYARAVDGQVNAGGWGRLEVALARAANSVTRGVPWPRAFGTLPWAVARLLGLLRLDGPASRLSWQVHRLCVPADGSTAEAAAALHEVLSTLGRWCDAGLPLPLYVGNDRLPRHVVLLLEVTADRVVLYDPAAGAPVTLPRPGVEHADAPIAGWRRLWCVLTPRPDLSSSRCRLRPPRSHPSI